MDILEYLIELLKIRKEIGVEGLGTFYKKKISGRYDTATHSFVPPKHELAFTNSLIENNHLKNYIREKRKISEESSVFFIQNFVNEIKISLQKNGSFNLQNLGTLTFEDEQLKFIADETAFVGFDYLSLPMINVENKNPLTSNLNEQNSDTENTNTSSSPSTLATEDNSETSSSAIFDEKVEIPPVLTEIIDEIKKPETEVNNNDENVEISPSAELENIKAENSTEENTQESNQQEEVAETDEPTEENTQESNQQEEVTETDKPTEENTVEEFKKTDEDPKEEDENEIFDEINDVYDQNVAKLSTESSSTNSEPTVDDNIKITTTNHVWDFTDNIEETEQPILDKVDTPDEIFTKKENTGIPLYQKFSLFALILLIIGGLAYYFEPESLNGIFTKKTVEEKEMVIPVSTPKLNTQADSLSFADSIVNIAHKNGLDIAPAKDTLKVSTKQNEIAPTYTYEIIAAAFAKNSETEEYIKYMKKKGFEAKVANMPGKLFKKISIASYNNLDSAQHHLPKLKKLLKNDKIYIQKIKNN